MRHLAELAYVLLLGALLPVAAQQPAPTPPVMHDLEVFLGDSQPMGNGVIASWVRVDQQSRPTAIGVSFSEAALTNLPERNTEYLLRLPELVAPAPFTHVAVDWEWHGHYPMQFYGAPHFDFHFYMISPQERGRITGAGADAARLMKQPAARYIPAGYVPAPPGVVFMGLHWIRPDFPEFHNQPFTQSLIYGSYNGRISFIEPMITREFLLTRPNLRQPVIAPTTVQTSGYYPTQYVVTFDAVRQVYAVALEGLQMRKGQ